MASTNKTPQLGLNQWAAGDEVLRADFNGDNLKIDTAMGAALRLVTGHFTPDKAAERTIFLGFRPKLIFFIGMHLDRYSEGALGVAGEECTIACFGTGSVLLHAPSLPAKITDTGFTICNSNFFNNAPTMDTNYFAIG